MRVIIIFLTLLLATVTFGQTKLQNERIEGNTLILNYSITLNYTVKKNGSKRVFSVSHYQDESAPGDVSLPSNDIFISLPNTKTPKIKFTPLSKQDIKAIPKFNDVVSLNEKDEEVYSKSKVLKNSKTNHFTVKGYLWIGDIYTMQIEVTPAIFLSSKNVIEIVNEFEIELSYNENITVPKILKKKNNSGIISNSSFEIQNIRNKYKISSSDSWIDYNKTYVKIGTALDGIYRVTKTDLEELDINTSSINPKSFSLYLKGEEVPIFVEGEDDLSFDADDFIEFVGIRNMGGHHREISSGDEPYNEYLGRYSDTTIYWLTWGGKNGLRVTIDSDTTDNFIADTLDYYSQTEHFEKNNWFDFSCNSQVIREMPYWCTNKTWHEGNLGVGERNRNFSCSDIYPDKQVKAFIKLQDFASDINTNAHKITLGINSGNWSDTVSFDKYKKVILTDEINSDVLNEGNNQLNIVSLQTSASLNLCIFDWYEIEYPRYLTTFDDSLSFTFPFIDNSNVKTIKLQNVQTENYELWRYGDKYERVVANKEGYNVYFVDTLNNRSKYIFLAETKIKKPKIYYLKQFKNLRSSENKADYIAITHNKFIQQVNTYADFIAYSYNVTTKVVDINDIYDEFSYGFFNPEAIKDFLMSTHTYWQTPYPQFVVLIGGATYDYFGYKHQNSGARKVVNYVPSFGAPVSDNWFVIWDSTANIMQMSIGRIPVTTNEELGWYFQKHQNYVEHPYDDWNKRYLFFSGGNFTEPSQIAMFRNVNDFIINNYVTPTPIGGVSTHFYKTVDPITNFGPYSQEEIQSAIDAGGIFIGYVGHSGTQTWDNSITQASQLLNSVNRSPVITDFGCSTARFAEPDVVSFSEEFIVKSDGQAINYIGNSSLGFTSTSTIFPEIFYKKILKDSITTIGEAYRLAKAEFLEDYGSGDAVRLFILTNELIGDPIVKIKIPDKPNLVVKKEDIVFEDSNINDSLDSLNLSVRFYNWGKVTGDSVSIKIIDNFEQNINLEKDIRRPIPAYSDSIRVVIPIKNKAGQHNFQVTLDTENLIDEIYENDNSASINYNVLSGAIKLIADYNYENTFDSSISLINPVIKTESETYNAEFSSAGDFLNPHILTVTFGRVLTKINIPEEFRTKRSWFRVRTNNSNNYSKTVAFHTDRNSKFSIDDSLSFQNCKLTNCSVKNNSVLNDTIKNIFDVISAGFNDGNSAVIMRNGQNFIPENTLRGHHVCLFSDSTYEFIKYKHFDLLGGGSETANEYIQFLDTLGSKYLVVFAISDEGAVSLNSALKDKIKEFGSVDIDSVVFRGSWAFIGKRDAPPGSMPEAFSKPFEGRVEIDSTISQLNSHGTLSTTLIGPASNWEKITVCDSLPSNSQIKFRVLGERNNFHYDTLGYLSFIDNEASLTALNDSGYSFIKILAELNSSSDLISPVLKSLAVNYNGLAELGTNYQVVSLDKDTVKQGETINLTFKVYNAGEISADSFNVKVDLIHPDNSSEQIYSATVADIEPDSNRTFSAAYNTVNYQGLGKFRINIDSENKIDEYFEDNNFYPVSFYVQKDTTRPKIDITFNGRDIIDGEYVSPNPEIRINMYDETLVPIADTTAVTLFLNNSQIYYSGNSELNISFSEENPKVAVEYTPKLKSGTYILTVFAKNGLGTYSDSAGLIKEFSVNNEPKLLNVYNYPNPFSDDTYFTFKLTRIPDEMGIDIYTVAGRLIRKIKILPTELSYDFNRIYWDGKDQDGDSIANGVYFYKIKMKLGEKEITEIHKLAVMR